jgi:hypothetical protein
MNLSILRLSRLAGCAVSSFRSPLAALVRRHTRIILYELATLFEGACATPSHIH